MAKSAKNPTQQDSYKIEKRGYYSQFFNAINLPYSYEPPEGFFNSCWREFVTLINNDIYYDRASFRDDNDVMNVIEGIASDKVNNPRSQFYMARFTVTDFLFPEKITVDEVETSRKKTHEKIQDLKKNRKEFLEKFFDRRYPR